MLMQQELSNPFVRRQQTALQGGCPDGGQWYACDAATSTGFVGCCTANACTSVGCAAGNLRNATLGTIPHGSTSDQACPFGGRFFTCVSPPAGANFWGCCKSVPCGNGCPTDDLAPAALAQTSNNPFAPSTSGTNPGSGDDDDSSTPTGAIVGGVVGGVLGLALIGVLIWWIRRKKQSDKKDAPAVPMAYNPHSQQADPGSNVPLTYPEVVDHYAAGTSPQPTKQNFPPSAFTSPPLPQYSDRRASHELGGGGGYDNGSYISPMSSPGFVAGSRPMSYELHGTGSPSLPQKGMSMHSSHTPSIMSAAVSELPADDMRYSQVSSTMRYSGQPPASPPPPPPPAQTGHDSSGAGLGLSVPGQSGERTEN
ncbi:hypothetical protein TWF481_007259 [Arthrobotrys musiformis]|uniref:Uncharacterized protein n=1 Tax=Arthrobotrys musiformis TaxID=47236 RepID=A0AAV9WAX0_9PEZI